MQQDYNKTLNLPEGKDYVFSARVSGDRAGMAYLSVLLFRDNREIRRFSSPLNPAFSRTLSVAFSTKESGRVQILLRTIHSRENVGSEAVFPSSAGASITLYLALWFAVTFLLRKKRM